MRSVLAVSFLVLVSGCGAYAEILPEHAKYQPGECLRVTVYNQSLSSIHLPNSCNPVMERLQGTDFVPVEYPGHEFCLLVLHGVSARGSKTFGYPLEPDRAPGTYRLVLTVESDLQTREVASESFEVLETAAVEDQGCILD